MTIDPPSTKITFESRHFQATFKLNDIKNHLKPSFTIIRLLFGNLNFKILMTESNSAIENS